MNKQIKLLAEQAGFYFYDMHDVDGQDLGETIEADSWQAAQRFMELIVGECIKEVVSECDDLNNGNVFGGENGDILFESVTSEYGRSKERGFEPHKIGHHLSERLEQLFRGK